MRKFSQLFALNFPIAIAIGIAAEPAYAYLDPGTGSMVLQALVAGFVGTMFAVKMYWAKIKSIFRKDDQAK